MSVKNLLAVAVIGATTAMVGCGSDDDNDGLDGGSNPTFRDGGIAFGTECSTIATHTGQEIVMEDGSYRPLCELSGTIEESATLESENVYRLNGYVVIGGGAEEIEGGDGETDAEAIQAVKDAGVTLTVEAGTHFRSSGKGSLIITRGSEIAANGTASAPIVMSSIDTGFSGTGEWGGLVLQGFAKNNQCGAASEAVICNTLDEADTGAHGGNDDADSSGTISHLIVAEGGFEIRTDEEVNGITLHSVGYGTSLSNIMVYGNADDGIEFFGGAANVKNLILVDNNDESLDWDDGWRGNVQYTLIRQGVDVKGDHGIEADTLGKDTLPESDPVVANVTFQTVNNNFGADSDESGSDDLFRFKKGTNGTLINVAADGYAECVKAEGTGVDVELVNVVAECAAYEGGSYQTGDAADGSIVYSDANVDATNFGNNTVDLGGMFEVTGANGTLSEAPAFPSANDSTGFFDATTYVGAVDPSASEAWYAWAEAIIPAAFQ